LSTAPGTVNKDGIYGVNIYNTSTLMYVTDVIAITGLRPVFSVKISDVAGNLYDNQTVIPLTVTMLFYAAIDGTPPYQYRTYVNGLVISGISQVNLSTISRNSVLFITVTDCCGRIIKVRLQLHCQ